MEQGEELEYKAKKGLEDFSKKGDPNEVEFDLHNKIDKLFMKSQASPPLKKKPVISSLIYIAIIIAVILALFLYFNKETPDDSQQIEQVLASYFEPFPNIMGTGVRGQTGEAGTTDSTINLGMEYYENKDYKSAILYLDKANVSIEIHLYAGIAYLAAGNSDAAIVHFQKILADKSHNLHDASTWYLALSYLKSNDKEKAISLFREISNQDNHYKKNEAAAILTQFD